MSKQNNILSLAGTMIDCSINRVLAIDAAWQIIAWNKTAEQITGIQKQQVLQQPLLAVFPEVAQDAEMMKAIETAMTGLTTFLPSKPGHFNRHYYENHFVPLKDNDGAVFGVMNMMHDVAHRVKAERQLEKLNQSLADKNLQLQRATTELATFTSITGHELKEPIRKAYTAIEAIARNDGPRLTDGSKGGLRRVQSSLNRMNLLLDDILTLATASSFTPDFSDVDLNIVLAEALEGLRDKIHEKQARIESTPLPVVKGSAQMLQYIFFNILDNAIKFQPEDNIPVITISVEQANSNKIQQPADGDEKKYACIHFTDNGIGFPQDEAVRIFTMFQKLHTRQQYGGSGIGLTISKKIAENHGGYIEARGVEGKGATFTCCLEIA